MILQVVLPVAFWELLWNDPLKKCLWGFQTQGNQLQAKRDHVGNLWSLEWIDKDTVDGRNPAHPVDIMVNIPLFTELHTCQVVSRISFINSTLKKDKVNQHFLDSSTLSKQGNKQTNKQTNKQLLGSLLRHETHETHDVSRIVYMIYMFVLSTAHISQRFRTCSSAKSESQISSSRIASATAHHPPVFSANAVGRFDSSSVSNVGIARSADTTS